MAHAKCVRAAVTAALTGILMMGCSSQEEFAQAVPESTPRPGGVIRMAMQPPSRIDPAFTDDAYESTVGNQIFSGLVHWDDDLNVLPQLAHSWTISRDGLNYEFELRPDAHFHNGRKVTANDFVYSFTRLFDASRVPPGIIQDYLVAVAGVDDYVAGRVDSISGLTAVDPLRLRITLSRPHPSFLNVLAMDQAKVVPHEVIESVGNDAFGRGPVGTGPFKIGSWTDDELILVKNRDYFGTPAYLDSLVYVHYPDSLSQQIKLDFVKGDLDARSLRAVEEDELKTHGSYFIIRRPELSLEILGFNVKTPPLDDVNIRRAISMSIDRDTYRRISGNGFYKPAGLLPPGMPGYTPESKIWKESVEEAKSLLAERGYGKDNPLQFDVFTASYSDYARKRDSVLVASLARADIIPNIERVGWKELEKHINDQAPGAFFIIWVADLPDPETFLFTLFNSRGQYNMFDYHDATVDSLLMAARFELNMVARLELYRASERLILKDAPCVPLFNFMNYFAFQPYVRGVEMSPFGLSGIPMEKIWIDQRTVEKVNASF